MIKYFLSFFFFINLFLFSEKLNISFPKEIAFGEKGEIRIKVFTTKIISFNLPEVNNLTWKGKMSSSTYSNINGKITSSKTKTLLFTINNPNIKQITIPSFKVYVGNKSYDTEEMTIKVLEAKKDKTIEEEIFVKVFIDDREVTKDDKIIFKIGEEKNFKLKVYHSNLVNISTSPTIDWDIIEAKQFNQPNWTRTFFTSNFVERILINGRSYSVLELKTVLVSLKPGELANPYINIPFFLKKRNKSFRGSFRRNYYVNKVLPVLLPSISVPPIPPLDIAGVINTRLIGEWQISSEVSKQSVKQGYAFDYKISFKGKGDTDRFKKPKINFNNFQVIASNVDISKARDKKTNIIELNTTLVPENMLAQLPQLKLAFFDTQQGEYHIKELNDRIEILPSSVSSQGPSNQSSNNQVDQGADSTQTKKEKEIKKEQNSTQLPEKKQEIKTKEKEKIEVFNIYPYIYIFLAVPAIYLLYILLKFYKSLNSVVIRKKKRSLLRKLKVLHSDGLIQFINNDFKDLVCMSLSLDSWKPLNEIFSALDDKKLVDDLLKISRLGFSNNQKTLEQLNMEQIKDSMRKTIKTL